MKRKNVLIGILLSTVVMLWIPVMTNVSAAKTAMRGYAEKDELLTKFNMTKNSKKGKILFGEKEWYIAGQDGKDTLALLATSSYGYSQFNGHSDGNVYGDDKTFYNKSVIKKYLEQLEKDAFTSGELNKIKETSVTTTDYYNKVRTVTGRLYLPGAETNTSIGADTIYLGSGNNIPIYLPNLKSPLVYPMFWLRTPYAPDSQSIAFALRIDGASIRSDHVASGMNVNPAMNLDLSSVLFASDVLAEKEGSYGTIISEAMTLRFKPAANSVNGSIYLKGNNRAIEIIDAPSNSYLIVQNNYGAWAKKVSGKQLILPKEVGYGLNSFDNCKVWIETTDADRITTAVQAVNGTSDITVNAGKNMNLESGSITQTGLYGDMDNVIYQAKEGYYFPKDYTDSIGEQNGVTVTRDNLKQITISGAPWDNTTLTLPDASPLKQPATPVLNPIIYSPVKTLADVVLPTVEGGSWNWDDETTMPSFKVSSYPATFTPETKSEYHSYQTNIPLNVEKATPDVSNVTSSGTYGNKLSNFTFVGSAIHDGQKVDGTFRWKDKETYPKVGEASRYPFEFIPDDKDNYHEVTGEMAVTVHKKPVNILINEAEKLYGDANPEFSFAVSNGTLVGKDTMEDLAVKLSCSADEKTAAGTKVEITGSSTSANYDVTIKPGTLTVKKRPLHIKVKDKNIKSKETLPSNYDYTISNLVAGVDAASIGMIVTIEPYNVPNGNPAGKYELQVSDWSIKDRNYTKGNIQEGTLTIYEDVKDNIQEGTHMVNEDVTNNTILTNKVDTGDTTSIIELIAITIISAIIIFAINVKWKRE